MATVKFLRLHPDAVIPKYAHGPEEDAGMDLCSIKPVTLAPYEPKLVRTGLAIELPPYFEAQIRPRSGLALKEAITVLNAPGTVDPAYRGEIGVILMWMPPRSVATCRYIPAGTRIAQMVVARYEPVYVYDVDVLSDTQRGSGGFGSTGK